MLQGKISSAAHPPKVSCTSSSSKPFSARGCLQVVKGKAVTVMSYDKRLGDTV